jgi:hypothetical protein
MIPIINQVLSETDWFTACSSFTLHLQFVLNNEAIRLAFLETGNIVP